MITMDGYKVEEGMFLTTNTNNDIVYEVVSVSDDTATYKEHEWDEEAQMYSPNGQGGLLWAEEIKREYSYEYKVEV